MTPIYLSVVEMPSLLYVVHITFLVVFVPRVEMTVFPNQAEAATFNPRIGMVQMSVVVRDIL